MLHIIKTAKRLMSSHNILSPASGQLLIQSERQNIIIAIRALVEPKTSEEGKAKLQRLHARKGQTETRNAPIRA